MTLRERVLKLSKIGGWDIIPNVMVVDTKGEAEVYSRNPDIYDVLFEDEDNSFVLDMDRSLIITSGLIDRYEINSRVPIGIAEVRTGDCLGDGDIECGCPVCENGSMTMYNYITDGSCMTTSRNMEAYKELGKSLGVNRVYNVDYLLELLKKKYREMIENPIDTKMVLKCTDSVPYSVLTYVDERALEYTMWCNLDLSYTEDEFIKSAFILAYNRGKANITDRKRICMSGRTI